MHGEELPVDSSQGVRRQRGIPNWPWSSRLKLPGVGRVERVIPLSIGKVHGSGPVSRICELEWYHGMKPFRL